MENELNVLENTEPIDTTKLVRKKYSEYHLQAEMAKKVFEDQEEREKDPFDKKFERYKAGKKGKSDGLNDKIKGAGVGDWKEQKLTKLSFFENMRKIFLDKTQISKTFPTIDVDYNKIPEKLLELEEGALPKNFTSFQIDYINQIGNELEKEYLENGL